MSWLTFVFSPTISIFLSIQLQHLQLFLIFLFFFHSTRSRRIFQVQRRCPTFQSFFFFIFGTSMKVLCSYFFSFVFITEENEKRERRKMERSLWEILKMGKNSNNKNINSNRKIFFARSWDVIACEWDFVT